MKPRNRADTQYAVEIYPWWNNLNDRVAYQREFYTGEPQRMRIAQAMISQDPLTPRSEIKRNMTALTTPSKYDYDGRELTIEQVLNNEFELADTHVDDSAWNDFSGSNGESNSTQRPYGGTW